jgi:hypothetical protein
MTPADIQGWRDLAAALFPIGVSLTCGAAFLAGAVLMIGELRFINRRWLGDHARGAISIALLFIALIAWNAVAIG